MHPFDILANVLRKNRAEVIDVILEEYDEEEFRKYLREEATQQGLAEGRAEGQNLERIHGIKNLIESFQELHISQEDTISKLIENTHCQKETQCLTFHNTGSKKTEQYRISKRKSSHTILLVLS